MSEQIEAPAWREWCVVELMGHVKLAGLVTEVELFGGKVARLDIYEGDAESPAATQFFGHTAIYRITPTTEKTARAFGQGRVPEPVARWELPAPKREAQPTPYDGYRGDDEDDDLDGREGFREDDEPVGGYGSGVLPQDRELPL